MKQLIILVSLFLFLVLVLGCGVRKVKKSEVKKDSISQIDTKEDIKTEIKNDICIDEFTIIPLDTSKQITINGKSYKNVVLKYKKTKDNSLFIETKKLSKSATVKSSSKEFKKDVFVFNWQWLLLLLLIPIGYYTYKFI